MRLTLVVDIAPPVWLVDVNPLHVDMESSYAELEVFQNDTVTLAFNVTQNGLPFDLSGYTIAYKVKQTVDSATYLINKAGTIVDATKGKLQVVLAGADTATVGNFIAQLSLTKGGNTNTVIQYPLIITASV